MIARFSWRRSASTRPLFPRRQPGDDLTTQLVQAEEDGSKLTNEEPTANIILLFGAGHETTVNLIGNGMLALHRNPEQLAKLKANPALMPNAIEEFLRYDSSVQLTGRVAMEDIEVGGGIHLCLGAQLARAEAAIAIETLLHRIPNLRIDDVEKPDWRPTFVLRGLMHLPASW